MGRVRVTSYIKQWTAQTEKKADLAVLQMATDIHRVSAQFAPKASRALVNSGRITRKGAAHYIISYGGGPVPYARRRHFENKKTPSSLRYLERAGDSTANNVKRYLKGL